MTSGTCANAAATRHWVAMIHNLLILHIAAGATALLSMIVPLVSRKGGRAHRRAGWVFVAGMTIVSATALVISSARFLSDARPEAEAGAVFLFYVAILTAAGVSSGIRVLRFKRRQTAHTSAWDLGVAAVLTAAGLAVAVYGLVMRVPLFVLLAAAGVANGAGQMRYWLRPPGSPM